MGGEAVHPGGGVMGAAEYNAAGEILARGSSRGVDTTPSICDWFIASENET
jgi:hypothetical protein